EKGHVRRQHALQHPVCGELPCGVLPGLAEHQREVADRRLLERQLGLEGDPVGAREVEATLALEHATRPQLHLTLEDLEALALDPEAARHPSDRAGAGVRLEHRGRLIHEATAGPKIGGCRGWRAPRGGRRAELQREALGLVEPAALKADRYAAPAS